jgi:hypothetical protein
MTQMKPSYIELINSKLFPHIGIVESADETRTASFSEIQDASTETVAAETRDHAGLRHFRRWIHGLVFAAAPTGLNTSVSGALFPTASRTEVATDSYYSMVDALRSILGNKRGNDSVDPIEAENAAEVLTMAATESATEVVRLIKSLVSKGSDEPSSMLLHIYRWVSVLKATRTEAAELEEMFADGLESRDPRVRTISASALLELRGPRALEAINRAIELERNESVKSFLLATQQSANDTLSAGN